MNCFYDSVWRKRFNLETVGNSVFGAQNFVWFVTEREGWAEFSESILRACIAGVKIDGIQSPAPRLLFDDKGDPVAFASFAFAFRIASTAPIDTSSSSSAR